MVNVAQTFGGLYPPYDGPVVALCTEVAIGQKSTWGVPSADCIRPTMVLRWLYVGRMQSAESVR